MTLTHPLATTMRNVGSGSDETGTEKREKWARQTEGARRQEGGVTLVRYIEGGEDGKQHGSA